MFTFLSNPLFIGVALLAAHTVQAIVHAVIQYKTGKDHSVKLDDAVALLDKLAQLKQQQIEAAAQNAIQPGGGA